MLLLISLSSCGAGRKNLANAEKSNKRFEKTSEDYKFTPNVAPESKVATQIVKTAKKFEGVKYKYGGTDKKGMDCSGLVFVSFLEEGVKLPRTSRDMSLQGKRLYLKEVNVGDLLFFETNKNRKVINHVGLVVDVDRNGIHFIHSSSSRGVIVSSLSESYWYKNFVMARRVI